jgi:hypothetical protein
MRSITRITWCTGCNSYLSQTGVWLGDRGGQEVHSARASHRSTNCLTAQVWVTLSCMYRQFVQGCANWGSNVKWLLEKCVSWSQLLCGCVQGMGGGGGDVLHGVGHGDHIFLGRCSQQRAFITRRCVVLMDRRFGTLCRSHLQRWKNQVFLDSFFLTVEDETDMLSRNVGTELLLHDS